MPLELDQTYAIGTSKCQRLYLWRILESLEELLERASLNPQQQASYARITASTRQREWLASKVMAREYLGQSINYDESGRPILTNGHISISHTGQYVALLFDGHNACGIDIENMSRDSSRLSHRFARAEELTVAHTILPQNPSLLVWCMKEAMYKVTPGDFLADFRIISAEALAEPARLKIKSAPTGVTLEARVIIHNDLLITYVITG